MFIAASYFFKRNISMSVSVNVHDRRRKLEHNSFGWYIGSRPTSDGKNISQYLDIASSSISYYGSNESLKSTSSSSTYKMQQWIIANGGYNSTNSNKTSFDKDPNRYGKESCSNPNDSTQTSSGKSRRSCSYGASSDRWFVLAVVCISVAVRSFVSVVFGQINDVFSAYFNVEPSSIDWITNLSSLTTLICVSFVACCNHKQFRLRTLCLCMAITGLLGTTLLTWAMTDRKHGFLISLIGQIFMGTNNAVVMTIPPLVTTSWFPAGEIATALAFILISVGIGEALGSYLPGVVVFFNEDLVSDFIEGSGEVGSGEIESELQTPFMEDVRYRLVMLFVFTAGLMAIVAALMYAFLKERPTIPPSYAELVIRKLQQYGDRKQRVIEACNSASETNCSITSSVHRSFESSKSILGLMNNKTFILTAILYGVVAASASTSITLLSSMIREADFDEDIQSNALSGKIMTIMWICFVGGSFGAGRLLDKLRCYRKVTIVGLFGVTVGCIGVSLSLQKSNVLGLYLAHTILGFSIGSSETSLFEIASEVTYPAPPLTFAALLTISWMIFFVAYPVIGRYLLNNVTQLIGSDVISNNTAVGLASSAPWLCALFCLIIAIVTFHPKHKRSDKVKKTCKSESTPLLHEISYESD